MKYLLSILLAGFTLVPLQAKAADGPMAPAPQAGAFDGGNTGIYLRGDIGASYLNWGSTSSPWAYVGNAGIGYQFDQNMRTDLTYDWSGNYGVSPTGNVSTNMVLANGYYDFKNASAFTPYIGAGIGYGWEWGSGAAVNAQGVAVGFAAGVAYDMNRNLALDVGYRFHDILGANQQTPEHQIAAGLRVKF
jgi:opacity protein-like surface antigen